MLLIHVLNAIIRIPLHCTWNVTLQCCDLQCFDPQCCDLQLPAAQTNMTHIVLIVSSRLYVHPKQYWMPPCTSCEMRQEDYDHHMLFSP